jgi:hypothetical protein
MDFPKLIIPLVKIRMPSGVTIFDADLRGRLIPLGVRVTMQHCVFTCSGVEVADWRHIARSFAIARFYVLEASDALQKMDPKLIHLPSLPTNKIVDPGRLMAGSEVKTATDIAWLPGQSVWAHNIEYLKFKDKLSEEVLIHFCGGRRVFHTGALALSRMPEWYAPGPLSGQTSFRSLL